MVGSSRNRILGLVEDSSGDVELLLHPAGVLLDPPVRVVGQAHAVELLLDPLVPDVGRDPVEVGEVPKVLPRTDAVVEPALAPQHEPDTGAELEGALGDIEPEDLGGPARREEKGREDLGQRRLPRPVRAEEPEDLSAVDLEVHPRERFRGLDLVEEEPLSGGEDPP